MIAPLFLLLILAAGREALPLGTAAKVRAFRHADGAAPRPVQLRGTVTYHSAQLKQLFLQDATGGVHVRLGSAAWPQWVRTGDVIAVTGTTAPDQPHTVAATKFEITPNPAKLKPALFDLSPGRAAWLDGKFVNARGLVRKRESIEGVTVLTLMSEAGEAAVVLPNPKAAATALVGAEVELAGVCTTPFNSSRVTPLGSRILMSDDGTLTVHKPGRVDPFGGPATPAAEVRTHLLHKGEGGDPVRVRGALTARWGPTAYLQDASGAVAADLGAGQSAPEPGAWVDVVGTPTKTGDAVGLRECLIRAAPDDGLPTPAEVRLDRLAAGGFHARLVRAEGKVEDVARFPGRLRVSLSDRGVLVEAHLSGDVADLGVGMRVAVVGVCDAERATDIKLILRSPHDVTVLARPPFWTAGRAWAVAGGVGAVCAIAVGWLVVVRHQVRRAATQIQKQFDDRARLEGQLRQAAKLEEVGRLAGGIAHDFNNLLTVINGCAVLMTESVDGGRPAELADEIRRAGERAADLTGKLLTFSRQKMVVPQAMDLNAVVRETADLLGRVIGERIAVELDLDVGLPVVKAEPGAVSRVVMNLAVNARDAMPDGGTLTLRTSVVGDGPAALARLSVTDTGCGMTDEVKARLFEPFFTTKDGRGTGLGLATVFGLVQTLGGRIRCTSTLGVGTTFDVDLPTTSSITDDMTPLPAALNMPPPLAAEFTTTVLLVEDDDAVRALARRVLEIRGYHVVPTDGPEEAGRVAETFPDRIDLLITDVVMPGMNGRELADRVRSRRPGLRVVYMSGYTADEIAEQGILDGEVAFVQKPFSPASLLAEVTRALGK